MSAYQCRHPGCERPAKFIELIQVAPLRGNQMFDIHVDVIVCADHIIGPHQIGARIRKRIRRIVATKAWSRPNFETMSIKHVPIGSDEAAEFLADTPVPARSPQAESAPLRLDEDPS